MPTSIREDLERKGWTLAADATCAQAAAAQLHLRALNGDVAAFKEIREATEEKAGYRIEPRDAADQKVELVVTYSSPAPKTP